MITKDQLGKMKDWYYINPSQSSFPISGWKLHIFGTDLEDSYFVGKAMEPIMIKYCLTMKIASQYIIDAAIGDATHPQYGKIATLYITPKIFLEEKVADLIEEIQEVLKDYSKTGDIEGDQSFDGKIHYRYEFSYPVDPKKGLSYHDYVRAYEPNRGFYNIPNNPDINHLLTKKHGNVTDEVGNKEDSSNSQGDQ